MFFAVGWPANLDQLALELAGGAIPVDSWLRTNVEDIFAADLEYGQVGMTETVAAQGHQIEVGIALYEDLLRPVGDGPSEGCCKLIADRREPTLFGAHVLGEYSAEIIQVGRFPQLWSDLGLGA